MLKTFEKRLLKAIFLAKHKYVTGVLRKLHNELNSWHFSAVIEMSTKFIQNFRKPEGKKQLRKLSCRWQNNTKIDFILIYIILILFLLKLI
jgi:hypothetical protein